MVRMFSVPSPAARTCRRNTNPIASASSATTKTTTTSVVFPPDRFTSCPTAAARVIPGIRPPRRLRARPLYRRGAPTRGGGGGLAGGGGGGGRDPPEGRGPRRG